MALPADERRRTYEKLQEVAHGYGIEVKVCACKNPDIAVGTCNIAGDWPSPGPVRAQASLLEGPGRGNT
jgi:hypothetical protein